MGWVIAGNIPNQFMTHLSAVNHNSVSLLSNNKDINCLMEKFWQWEELENNNIVNTEDELAEKIFRDTTEILENGSFQVSMLLKTPTENCKFIYFS